MSSKSSPALNQLNLPSTSKFQYRLINNNRLILVNRQTLFSQFFSKQQNDNFCLYLHRFCLQNRLEGYNFCIRHILGDKNAPFRQCTFINVNTSKRCPNAARRLDRRDTVYCPWHIKKKNLDLRKKEYPAEPTSNLPDEVLRHENVKRKLEDLEHYCPSQEHDHRRKNVDWDLPEDKCVTTNKTLKKKMIEAFECESQFANDDEMTNVMLSDVLNLDLIDSDNESAESYMDDPLRNAGTFSAEEVAHILRDKMLRLQTLYINLFNYYRHTLKNKMRNYYLNLKNERLKFSENASSYEEIFNIKEEKDLKLFKAMQKYNNISGAEKVIKDSACKIRRCLIEESQESTASYPSCIYVKDCGVCNQRCVPLSNYCRTHILYDPHQILYRPCAGGSPPCLNPVISYIHKNSCIRHVQIKFDAPEIDNILGSPIKIENSEPNTSISQLANEPELFNTIDDVTLGIDSVVQSNLFGLDNFDLDNTDML